MRSLLLAFILCLGSSTLHAGSRFDDSHGQWTALLQKHVQWFDQGTASAVDYPGFQADQAQLQAYLDGLSAVTAAQYRQWSRAQQLAFLINAYNAFTVQLIFENYPLESIKQIGGRFSNAWRQPFIPLLGQTLTLDDIEHGMIRQPGVFDDPRIHFAVNCASIGCPALRNEAFVARRLDAQLQDSQQRFLRDRSRNRYDPQRKRFVVSKIFQWYGEDFDKRWGSLERYLQQHADTLAGPSELERARQTDEVAFGFYDWNLNQRTSATQQ
jgi:hypothetical protein